LNLRLIFNHYNLSKIVLLSQGISIIQNVFFLSTKINILNENKMYNFLENLSIIIVRYLIKNP